MQDVNAYHGLDMSTLKGALCLCRPPFSVEVIRPEKVKPECTLNSWYVARSSICGHTLPRCTALSFLFCPRMIKISRVACLHVYLPVFSTTSDASGGSVLEIYGVFGWITSFFPFAHCSMQVNGRKKSVDLTVTVFLAYILSPRGLYSWSCMP